MKIVIELGDEKKEEPEFPCPKCGEEVEQDDLYCDDCGAKLPVAKPTMSEFSKARVESMKKMMSGASE